MLAVASEDAREAMLFLEGQWLDTLSEEEQACANAVVDMDADEASCPACGASFDTSAGRCSTCGLNLGG